MANHAALTQRFVLVDKRATLHGVTLEAGLVLTEKSHAAAFERLLHIGAAPFYGDSDVRIVTIGATHFAFQHRMPMRQLKLRAHIQVALETGLGRFSRIYDCVCPTTAFDVQTSRS